LSVVASVPRFADTSDPDGLIAALRADGETVISDAHHIDRGYEHFVERTSAIGIDIERLD
jgi:UDP-N-acetylglucosamine enolpyruvyl transferase